MYEYYDAERGGNDSPSNHTHAHSNGSMDAAHHYCEGIRATTIEVGPEVDRRKNNLRRNKQLGCRALARS